MQTDPIGSRVTIRDVARQAGVSVATVSKVLNDRYGVSADTTVRVKAVIEELGYEASLVAQSLRNHQTNVIGILVADLEPFSAELLKGAGDAVRGSGFELVVYSAGGRARDQVGWERRYLSRLSGTLVDGAVLVTPTVVDLRYGAPVVAVDPHTGPGGGPTPTVDSDNLRGAYAATEHLLGLGHRRIAMLTGRPDLLSAQLRERGFREAMAAAGAAVDEGLVRLGSYDPDAAAAQAGLLLAGVGVGVDGGLGRAEGSERPGRAEGLERQGRQERLGQWERPTAVFAANDLSAIATMEVARGLGLRVPEDLSVVGFDDIPEATRCTPMLTTVEQPIREMGRRAVELLIGLVRGEHEAGDTHIMLPTRLVVRGSTAVPGSGLEPGQAAVS